MLVSFSAAVFVSTTFFLDLRFFFVAIVSLLRNHSEFKFVIGVASYERITTVGCGVAMIVLRSNRSPKTAATHGPGSLSLGA
jgi:hypothetical protein